MMVPGDKIEPAGVPVPTPVAAYIKKPRDDWRGFLVMMVPGDKIEPAGVPVPTPVAAYIKKPRDDWRGFLVMMVPGDRIELPTRGFSIPCSTN